MRKWYKFWLNPSQKRKAYIPKDDSFNAHEKAIGGYGADESYNSQEAFFNKYFFGYHSGRLEHYDEFIRERLKNSDEVLSIGSGRCANELYLMKDGYRVTCSDLERFGAYDATKRLFPDFEHIKLDILEGPSQKKYDVVVSLSLLYLFDEEELLSFFKNTADSLRIGGRLILDCPGSPDNLLSYLIHDLLLKYETMLKQITKSVLEKRSYGLAIKDHGYRRKDREVIESAQKFGFEFVDQKNFDFLTEFNRSQLLGMVIRLNPIARRAFSLIGRNIPYIRMYSFRKAA